MRRDRYAFVFLDCPPSLGPLTVNALAAADRVLVPVQAEYYALEGLAQLARVGRTRSRAGSTRVSRVGGVLLTMVDGRTRLAADVAAEVGGTSASSSSHARPALGAPRRGAEPRPAR